jgi:membrane associated rhomboid family serine protease
MFRSRGENLRSVFVLLFLNAAFFLLEHQDPGRYARLFAFDRAAVLRGEVWRLFTFQFTQSGQGAMQALSLFITLLLLYLMGASLEEEWGTRNFLALFTISTMASAAVAAALDIPLLGAYFVYFTLLFVYAAAFPLQTFYLLGIVPVRARLLAVVSLGVLVYGVFRGGMANVAALAGAGAGFVFYLWRRLPAPRAAVPAAPPIPQVRIDSRSIHNAARFAAIRSALQSRDDGTLDELLAGCERDVVAGVNICPPGDYKPAESDGYCIRCEGFAQCSARFLKASRAAV